MKLSDAILKGCEMSPKQIVGKLLDLGADDIWQSCALGAAYLGVYGPPIGQLIVDVDEALSIAFPILDEESLEDSTYYGFITNLNDVHKLTREQIAERLRELGL